MIVKTVRAIGSVGGKVLDAEDRKVIGQLLVIAGAFALVVVTIGVSLGLAVRAFDWAGG